MKRSPVRRVNAKRRAKRFRDAYGGPKAEWLRTLPCVMRLQQGCSSQIEVHHVRSRGAGGASKDTVSLCSFHHGQLHAMGRKSFEAFYINDLSRAAEKLEGKWQDIERTAGRTSIGT